MKAEVSLKPLVNPWHKVCCSWYFLLLAKGEPRGALPLRGNIISVRRDLVGAGEVVVQMGLELGIGVVSHSAAHKAEDAAGSFDRQTVVTEQSHPFVLLLVFDSWCLNGSGFISMEVPC